jgi:hypothetical protein
MYLDFLWWCGGMEYDALWLLPNNQQQTVTDSHYSCSVCPVCCVHRGGRYNMEIEKDKGLPKEGHKQEERNPPLLSPRTRRRNDE